VIARSRPHVGEQWSDAIVASPGHFSCRTDMLPARAPHRLLP
jgi:hypothetical protein